jgi:Fur family transcriptional regulator, ferric uptake regulator
MNKVPSRGDALRARPPKHAGIKQDFLREKTLFVAFLSGKSLKLTRQRETVVDEIFASGGHFEAEDMVERLKRKKARVSRATVYRTLELLQECRLVEKVNFGTTRSFYEHVHLGEHHDHIICTRCNVVIEFVDERIEKLQEEICASNGIRLESHSMRLFGECNVCRLGKDGPRGVAAGVAPAMLGSVVVQA